MIGSICLALTLSAAAFSALQDTLERLVIGTVLLLIGLLLLIWLCVKHVYPSASWKRRRSWSSKGEEYRTNSEAIIQMSENIQQRNPDEEIEEAFPLKDLSHYESLKT